MSSSQTPHACKPHCAGTFVLHSLGKSRTVTGHSKRTLLWVLVGRLPQLRPEVAAEHCLACCHEWPRGGLGEHHNLQLQDILLPGLEAIAERQELQHQSQEFQQIIALWRFVPTDETCIERHHAQVSVHKRSKKHMGAVAVSLCNRWASLEAFAEDPARQDVLLASFAQARNLQSLPGLLGIETHPMIKRCLSLLPEQEKTLPSKFLPHAATVPGMQHIIDNVLRDAHTRLPWWSGFLPRVKANACQVVTVVSARETTKELQESETVKFCLRLKSVVPVTPGSASAIRVSIENPILLISGSTCGCGW